MSANITGLNTTFTSRFQNPLWIAATSVNILSFCFLTWIVTGFYVYGKRKGKFVHLKEKDALKRHGAIVFLSALVAFVSCYSVLMLNVVYYNIGFESLDPRPCEALMDTLFTCYKFSAFLILIYYWLRQRALYQNQVMIDLAQKSRVKFFTWASLAILIVGFTVEIISFTIPQQGATSGNGCATLPIGQITLWPLYICVLVFVTGQVIMLGLFVYPLRQHSQRETSNRRRVNLIYKRNAILVALTITSNVMTLALPVAVPFGATIHGPEMWFEINLMLISFSVVLSYRDWWEILFPCRCGKEQNVQPVSAGIGSTNV